MAIEHADRGHAVSSPSRSHGHSCSHLQDRVFPSCALQSLAFVLGNADETYTAMARGVIPDALSIISSPAVDQGMKTVSVHTQAGPNSSAAGTGSSSTSSFWASLSTVTALEGLMHPCEPSLVHVPCRPLPRRSSQRVVLVPRPSYWPGQRNRYAAGSCNQCRLPPTRHPSTHCPGTQT